MYDEESAGSIENNTVQLRNVKPTPPKQKCKPTIYDSEHYALALDSSNSESLSPTENSTEPDYTGGFSTMKKYMNEKKCYFVVLFGILISIAVISGIVVRYISKGDMNRNENESSHPTMISLQNPSTII